VPLVRVRSSVGDRWLRDTSAIWRLPLPLRELVQEFVVDEAAQTDSWPQNVPVFWGLLRPARAVPGAPMGRIAPVEPVDTAA
jgi:hypothetical protein